MNKFCPLATNNIEVTADGSFTPCCISTKKFQVNGKTAYANIDNIGDVITGSDRKNWIENFDLNYENDCRQCYEVETSGGTSKRQREITYWKNAYKPNTLQSIDLKMGNTCNLQCAICGPIASSKWASFYRNNNLGKQWKNNNWPDREEFWDGLNEVASDIVKIELSGGEPFMIKNQTKLIDFLVNKGLAKNIDITWFTNCTMYPEHIISRFGEFKYVRIMLSLDNTDEQFEFQRYPAKWNEVYEIFLKFKTLHDQNKINLGISHTIGLFNIWRLPEFHKWCRDHEVLVFNNLLMDPISSKDLPYDFKLVVKEKLEQETNSAFQINPAVGPDNWLIKFMMQEGNSENNVKHYYKNMIVPSRPELDAKVIFPELREILTRYEK